MSRFIIVQQEKGGVGKTFLAIHLTTYLRSLGHKFRPVDLDNDPGLVSEVFPPPDSAAISPLVTKIENGSSKLPSLIEKVIAGDLFIVDAGANTAPCWTMLHAMLPHLREEMEAAGIKTTVVVPVQSDSRTRKKFVDYAEQFPGATRIMAVMRKFEDEKIDLPEHPPELTIEIPFAFEVLFSAYQSMKTPMDVIARSEDLKFGISRSFAKGYVRNLHAQFDKVREHLIP